MNILIIDTSFNQLQYALLKGFYLNPDKSRVLSLPADISQDADYQLFYATNLSNKNLGETAIDTLDDFLDQAGLNIADLHCLAINTGPGSFAGTRIATSIAQGIMSAHTHIKCISMSSLEMIAAQVGYVNNIGESKFFAQDCNVIVAVDANMNEAYINVFNVSHDKSINVEALGNADLVTIVELEIISNFALCSTQQRQQILVDNPKLASIGLIADHEYVLVGNAWDKYVPTARNLQKVLLVDQDTFSSSGLHAVDGLAKILKTHCRNCDNMNFEEMSFNVIKEFTLLPDLRLQAPLVLSHVRNSKFTDRKALEPNYIRDNIAYPTAVPKTPLVQNLPPKDLRV